MDTRHAVSFLTVAPAVNQSLPMLLLRLRETMLLQLRPILRTFELTEQQARVLLVLREAGSQKMLVLAEACCIAPPSLSRIIPKLRTRGLVEVERIGQDQRLVLAALSSTGSQVAAELRDALRRAHGEIKRRVGDQQIRTIAYNIQEAIAALGNPDVMASPSASASEHDADEEG